ncbi:hypothetical protein [Microbispora sp. CA-102843]|uniref:hypothetical protein n=1 Tax=Microbispora sp. CA-102843 TaxID=3239952 RepID=UPI003D8FB843
MLDLLLQRPEDLDLWEGCDLAYVVVDEFHSYDGAQGTDVAMLLRRLAAAVGQAQPGNPMGGMPVLAENGVLAARTALDGGTRAYGLQRRSVLMDRAGSVPSTHKSASSHCPRCGNTDIGDSEHLHKVLRPRRVTARDRRDDALIRDDREQRERVFYC